MTETLELNYSLAELPSAQHRAGLAGLNLMTQYLHNKPLPDDSNTKEAKIEFEVEDYSARLACNFEGLKQLFDLTYAAFEEERSTDKRINKFTSTEEIEITDKKGKPKLVTRYFYSVVVPDGAFLLDLDPSHEGKKGLWIKLWRDMVWESIRGIPSTRKPYENRLQKSEYLKDIKSVWEELLKARHIHQSSSYYVGAMASTSESVKMYDSPQYQLLLHFWPFVTQVYCPTVYENKKDSSKGTRKIKGYALAIPDVSNLSDFCELYPDMLLKRSTDKHGYRPREALIDIPEEGALEMLRLLRDRTSRSLKSAEIVDYVSGIELIHLEKVGNSLKIRSSSYIEPRDEQIDRYSEICSRDGGYWCPWFRKQRLLNLLASSNDSDVNPWTDFDSLLCSIPRSWIDNPYFSHDARTLLEFDSRTKKIISEEKDKMLASKTTNEKSSPRSYIEIVYSVCQNYVSKKMKAKYDLDWASCKHDDRLKNNYNAKKEKVVNEAFLAVRARTENQAFIDYFVSTLYPFTSKSEFSHFASRLFESTDEIRALTLLALSSQFPFKESKEKKGEKDS